MDQQPIVPSASLQSTEKPPTELPAIPDVWPGAWGLYKYSKRAVRYNLGTIFWLSVLPVLINLGVYLSKNILIKLLADTVILFLSMPLVIAAVASVRGKKISIKEAVQATTPTLVGNYILASIIAGVISILSVIALVIPAFFIIPRLALVSYFVLDKKLGAIESISASWEATRGNVGKVWGIAGVNIVFALLILALLSGVYFLFMYSLGNAILYLYLERTKPATTNVTPEPLTLDAQTQHMSV